MSFFISVPDHILFEDDYILVIDKPAGLMVEPDRNNYPNLLQQVQKYLKGKSPGEDIYAQHIHRLDRPVSGVILFAKQRSVLKNLSEQFAGRRVKKYYQALTDRSLQHMQGTLQHWLRKEKKKAVIFDQEMEYTEQVKLDYSIEPIANDRFRWTIELHTGKYHQIRAQLTHMGCPIIGDQLYGSTLVYKEDQIALHAYQLIFHHPITDAEMNIKSSVL